MVAKMMQFLQRLRHRHEDRELVELDEHLLADVGLLRTRVRAALSQSFPTDPSMVLQAVCCHWHTFTGGRRPTPGSALCCE